MVEYSNLKHLTSSQSKALSARSYVHVHTHIHKAISSFDSLSFFRSVEDIKDSYVHEPASPCKAILEPPINAFVFHLLRKVKPHGASCRQDKTGQKHVTNMCASRTILLDEKSAIGIGYTKENFRLLSTLKKNNTDSRRWV